MGSRFKSQRLSIPAIPGQAGELEARLEASDDPSPAFFGVLCHPHPLYGGTLDNKVVYTLARAFQECGTPTIRFNFRGVGASPGEFDHGIGETQDALAAVAFGRAQWPDAALWLGGFSFGGAVAIRAAATARPAGLVTVAPAVSRVDLRDSPMPECPWLIVQGTADDVVLPQEIDAWAKSRPQPPQLALLEGAGHFFHGKLNELRDTVKAFLEKTKPG